MEKFEPTTQETFKPAPQRFKPGKGLDEPWEGKPSVSYGIVRLLAFKERQKSSTPYARVLFGEGGRRGDPWGGLHFEVNGKVYHFGAGMKERLTLHNGQGGLTDEGLEMIANGVPGKLDVNQTDWRWIQDELDITSLLDEATIQQIETYYSVVESGALPVPTFQSKAWTKRLGKSLNSDYYNCTTIIANLLNKSVTPYLHQDMPLDLFEELRVRLSASGINSQSKLDQELSRLLWLNEVLLQEKLQTMVESNTDLSGMAKGITALNSALTWEAVSKISLNPNTND